VGKPKPVSLEPAFVVMKTNVMQYRQTLILQLVAKFVERRVLKKQL
jgi:hypothetical protein